MPFTGTSRRVLAALLLAVALLGVPLLGASPRVASADSAAAPYGMIVMLQIRTPKSDITCTGFMVGPHTVATAAHCLYNPEFGGWASSVFVTPGIDGLDAPYATEWATSFTVSPTWVQTRNLTADYGAITLASNALGNATGWFEVATPTDYELANGRYVTAGYGTSASYGTLWRVVRPARLAEYDSDILGYLWGTSSGESGAPIFDPTPGGRYRAVGLVKGAFTSTGDGLEFGLRLNSAMQRFYGDLVSQPQAAPAEQTLPTMFTGASGVPVLISSPVTRANTAAALQSSLDQVVWTAVDRATTDAQGVGTYKVVPTETRYYRVVVQGVGTGRVGRGIVASAEAPGTTFTAAAPLATASARGSFAGTPAYSPRVALAVFYGGTTQQLDAALAARARGRSGCRTNGAPGCSTSWGARP